MSEPAPLDLAPVLDLVPPLDREPFDRIDVDRSRSHDHAVQLRRAILHDLRSVGPSSPDEVGRRVGTSRTSVLQQLRALESAGLARHETVRHGVGRPRHVYDLTPVAQGLFPTNYDGLATDMLAAIQAVGGQDLVDDVFRARSSAVVERVRQRLSERLPADATLAERVRELAVIQDESGYLCDASLDPDGTTVRLSEHNCAIHRVAMGQPSACAAELEMFSDILGAEVVRETHIMGGDRCCSYRIREIAPD
jgi:predicted ArsR family transcriptional regulator